MKSKQILLLFSLFAILIFGQIKKPFPPDNSYPNGVFRNPLGINNFLAGNFAELRNNHFHAGIDIKTNQKEGYNLYAIGDGYVSRVNVSPRGYGNAVYIDHPNGYTSVYAHMQKFNDKIAAYVRKKQYELESFKVELYLEPGEIPLTKGEIIGLSGNSGSSGGPHLHFEIRHTETEEPINPFFFGYDVADTRKPSINGLYLYPINGDVVGKTSRHKLPAGLHFKSPIYASGKVGIGVKAYDKHNGAENNNGIHQIDVIVNDEPIFTYTANRFNYNETRAINGLCDYEARLKYNSWIYQCFVDEGSPLRMFSSVKNNGIIDLEEGKRYKVNIIVSDYAGNQQTASYTLIGKKPPIEKEEVYKNPMYWNEENSFESDGIQVSFPKGIFYEDFDLSYKKSGTKHHLGNWNMAVHSYFDIALKPEGIPASKLDKAVLVRQYQKKGVWKKDYLNGEYKNGMIVGTARDLGIFSLEIDETKPYIKPLNIKEGSTFSKSKPTIRFSVSDRKTGIEDFDAFIDGKWVLAKIRKNRISINLEKEGIKKGLHQLELKVWDEKNNTGVYKVNFKKI